VCVRACVYWQVLVKWRATHSGNIPKTGAEKDALREMIDDMQVSGPLCLFLQEQEHVVTPEEHVVTPKDKQHVLTYLACTPELKDEENFVEAKQLARHAYSPFEIPSEVKAILADPKVQDDSDCLEPFWCVLVRV